MSATNHTSTIGLSQYVSTDKPTYLTDYNGDMLAIDNAIAADRDNIATAQNVADRADGKADTNKGSIDTINAQLNGDPTDPSDTGLTGDVSAVEGAVNTINSLIGNGTPTTSDQTIIGAINSIEGSIAPREDSADFANSYTIGQKFTRGGTVYEALASITAGTAFASLVLNTDYKVADTIVKQIEDAASGSGAIGTIVNSVEDSIAPREDGTTLAENYSVGDQFIRAGVLYEALDSLTAGDAFASLVLNTDYKIADTLVEQIKNAGGGTLPTGYYLKERNSVSVSADGTKTYREIAQETATALYNVIQSLANDEFLQVYSVSYANSNMTVRQLYTYTNASSSVTIYSDEIRNLGADLMYITGSLSTTLSNNNYITTRITTAPAVTITDNHNEIATNSDIIRYYIYKAFETT